MALQAEAIDSRLEGLKQDDHRMIFDSKLRAFRMDSETTVLAGARASKLHRNPEREFPEERMISIIEELSRRIDNLEKKDRAHAESLRKAARRDHCLRSFSIGCGFAGCAFFVADWMMSRI